MIYLELLKFIRRPGPSLLPMVFMVLAAFLAGFLKQQEWDFQTTSLLFCLLISLSLKINFGSMVMEEKSLGILPLITKSPYGFFKFISFKLLISVILITLPALAIGVLISFKGLVLLPLFILVLLINQTSFEILLSNLNAPPGSQFLSALIMLPLEIPVLLLMASIDLSMGFQLKVLTGAFLINLVILKGVWALALHK